MKIATLFLLATGCAASHTAIVSAPPAPLPPLPPAEESEEVLVPSAAAEVVTPGEYRDVELDDDIDISVAPSPFRRAKKP